MNICSYCHREIDTEEDGWGFMELAKQLYISFHKECLEIEEEVSINTKSE